MSTCPKPKNIDVIILSLFVVLITFQPFFMHGPINLFEVGLYLPGIDAILNGLVPFRDFFYLRGAFEIYIPAYMMSVFGVHIGVMNIYFYLGNIACLILAVLIGRELYKTRLILYLMVPVFVARTFPRVVFAFWGGFRYAFGLLAIYGAIKFFKKTNSVWMVVSGVATAVGLFTSVEIGVCSGAGILFSLILAGLFRIQNKNVVLKGLMFYSLGIALVAIPYGLYLFATQSLFAMFESVWAVIHKEAILDTKLVCPLPSNLGDVIQVMLNPGSDNFRHITPCYLYLIFLFYCFNRIRKEKMEARDLAAIATAVYGVIMYNAAFRNIWAAQFEMALQPEKILLFYLLDQAYLFLRERKAYFQSILQSYFTVEGHKLKLQARVFMIRFLILGLVMSSLGYSWMRFNQRFYTFRYLKGLVLRKDFVSDLKPWANTPSRPLRIERAKGVIVPVEQADELEQVGAFIEKNTHPNEALLMYPEYGTYNFLFNRPFVGRFPIPTFSWFNEKWHQEFMSDLKKSPPRYVIFPKKHPDNWVLVYLTPPKSRKNYVEEMDFIKANYSLDTQTARSYIYKRNGG